jgi:hypothetical protein
MGRKLKKNNKDLVWMQQTFQLWSNAFGKCIYEKLIQRFRFCLVLAHVK